ncbi:MAG: MFS transporter [Fimbriimonas sp.]
MNWRERLPLLVCYASMAALAVPGNLIALSLTQFGREFQVTNEALGRLPAVTCTSLVIALLLGGPLADRLGPRRFFLTGSGLLLLGQLGYAFCTGYPQALISSFLYGAGIGCLDLIASPVVAALYPQNKAAMLNRVHAFFSIGCVVALGGGLAALSLNLNWRIGFLVFSIVPLAVFIAALRAPFPAIHHEESKLSGAMLVRRMLFWLLFLLIFFCGASETGLAVWLPAHVERTFATTPMAGGFALFAFFIAMSIGRLFGGKVLESVTPERLLFIAAAITAPLIAVAAWSANPWVSCGAATLIGLAVSVMWPTCLAIASGHYPTGGATLFGLLSASGNASGIATPWMIGWIADRSTIQNGVGMTALAPIMMLVLIPVLRLRRTPES